MTIEKPGQYINREWNSIHKDFDKQSLKIALAFPDLYEIGMSNLGQRILYHIFNNINGVVAERVYAPAQDFENLLRSKNIPLISIESGTPLNKFDIVGFTLQNETSYTNCLNMLNLADIPILAQERTKKHPLIIAGGPCVFNPEPMASFFDAFVIGDGEEIILEIAEICKNWQEKFIDREGLLIELAKLKGVYIPSFYICENNCLKPKYNWLPLNIEKNIVYNLDKKFYPAKFLVPNISIVHDRAILEISRGCSRGCRFCQAGITYRPVRNRSREDIALLAKELIASTGYDEISLASLCAGDFPCIEGLVEELINVFESQKVSVSLPSQRLDNFSIGIAKAIQSIRKTGLTFAPEAGSQRLRDVINKGISDEDLINTAAGVFKNGWKNIKLYFMIGLPTETYQDIEAIRDLIKEIQKVGKKIAGSVNINISISPFIPKPHTPFQWEGQEDRQILWEKINYLKSYFHKNIKFQSVEMSFLEAALTRGGRELGKVIKTAYEKGAKFDSWDGFFNFNIWEQAFNENGLDSKQFANKKFDLNSNLPWDHINTGVSKDFLKKEFEKAHICEKSENCHNSSCQTCGLEKICLSEDFQKFQNKTDTIQNSKLKIKNEKFKIQNGKIILRIKYSKTGMMQFISHLNLLHLWNRAFKRAEIPVVFSQGFNPKPLISFGTVLPVGMTSISEYLEAELTELIDLNNINARLNINLPMDIKIIESVYCKPDSTSLAQKIFAASYTVEISEEFCLLKEIVNSKINSFLNSQEIIFEKKGKSSTKKIDIRQSILKLCILPTDEKMLKLYMVLLLNPNEYVRPQDILKYLLDFNEKDLLKNKFERVSVFFNGSSIENESIK